MAGEPKDGISIPYSGLAVVALLATTLAVQQAQLDSGRLTASETRRFNDVWLQDVEARLWQDPFGVVDRYRKTRRTEAQQDLDLGAKLQLSLPAAPSPALPPDDVHTLERLLVDAVATTTCSEKNTVRLVGAMVFGGSSEEDAEMRRRTRYAVVSALISAGYAPENADNIGYVYFPKVDAKYDERTPRTLPFEWYEREPKGQPKERLALLWLDQSYYYNVPVRRLRHLQQLIAGGACSNIGFQVLGPPDSDGFAAAVADMEERTVPGGRLLGPLQLVSTSATSPLPGKTIPLVAGEATLHRLIGTDDRLVRALLHDLQLRRPHGELRLAVVGELDTGYGRALIEQSRLSVQAITPDAASSGASAQDDVAPPDPYAQLAANDAARTMIIREFGYMRQLDGGVPASGGRDDGKNVPERRRQIADRAHGAQQYDYLRRLAGTIRRQFDDKPVDAIALFGNDVYDKLLMLRALRGEFPSAVFMTTDADARLLDPQEAAWTQNLVVASNFGLTLHADLQRGPPFRDGYQAAAHLGALLVAGDCAKPVLDRQGLGFIGPPRLYEVGRAGFVPLHATPHTTTDLSACALQALRDPAAKKSAGIQPSLQPGQLGPTQASVLAALLLAMTLWLYALAGTPAPLTRRLARLPHRLRQGWTAHPVAALYGVTGAAAGIGVALLVSASSGLMTRGGAVFLGFILGLLHCLAFRSTIDPGAAPRWTLATIGASVGALLLALYPVFMPEPEPFAWSAGVSVWPTQLIRWCAAALGIFSLVYIHRLERRNARTIRNRYRLGASPGTAPHGVVCRWDAYLAGRSRRSVQTLHAALAYLFIGSGLMALLGATPGVPARGAFNILAVQVLIGYAVILAIVLVMGLMWAYRAAVLQLCRPLMSGPIRMPTAAAVGASLHLPAVAWSGGRSFVDLYLAHGLVAERLAVLTRMVYFPFAVCALMIVARSRLFDGWDTPAGLAVLLLLPFALLFGAIVLLRNNTITFHDCIVHDMRDELLRMRQAVDDKQLWQLERLLAQVEQEKRGSFESLAVQPFIRALLLPVGGFSGIELLEHLVLR